MDRLPDARSMQTHAQPALDCVEPYAAANCCMFEQILLVLYASIALESETPIFTKWSLLSSQTCQQMYPLDGSRSETNPLDCLFTIARESFRRVVGKALAKYVGMSNQLIGSMKTSSPPEILMHAYLECFDYDVSVFSSSESHRVGARSTHRIGHYCHENSGLKARDAR